MKIIFIIQQLMVMGTSFIGFLLGSSWVYGCLVTFVLPWMKRNHRRNEMLFHDSFCVIFGLPLYLKLLGRGDFSNNSTARVFSSQPTFLGSGENQEFWSCRNGWEPMKTAESLRMPLWLHLGSFPYLSTVDLSQINSWGGGFFSNYNTQSILISQLGVCVGWWNSRSWDPNNFYKLSSNDICPNACDFPGGFLST